jgi:hypothetical protein
LNQVLRVFLQRHLLPTPVPTLAEQQQIDHGHSPRSGEKTENCACRKKQTGACPVKQQNTQCQKIRSNSSEPPIILNIRHGR